jgi:hypothetical protein
VPKRKINKKMKVLIEERHVSFLTLFLNVLWSVRKSVRQIEEIKVTMASRETVVEKAAIS